MRTTDLTVMRKNTEDMIAARPTSIALIRPVGLVSDGAGGMKPVAGSPTNFSAKNRFLSEITDATKIPFPSAQVEYGINFVATHILVGTYDDNVQKGDYFVHNGRRLTVMRIFTDRTYETKALLGEESEVLVRSE